MHRVPFRFCLIALLLVSLPVSAQQRELGVNLSWVTDYANMFIFVDVFKASRPWISHRPSDDTWDSGASFDVDEHGWVRSLKPDQHAGTLMLIENGDRYPAGEYLCLYEGEGEIHFDWDAQIVRQEPGRIVFNVTPEIGIHMVIRSTNPDNYIRNIRVIMPGFETMYETQPFHPTYIDFLRNFSTLRFMDWGQMTENPPGEWAQRTTPLSATQASIKGVALEYMVEMANTVGANAWVCVPHTATDEYVSNMAQLIRDQLRPDLRVYVEYSNETWNPDFPQFGYVRDRGLALGLDSDPTVAALRFHSQRSVEVFDIFEREFGSTARVVRVMGARVDTERGLGEWFAEQVLDWQNAYEKTDALAIGPYFGWFMGTPAFANQLASMSIEAILDSAEVDMRNVLDASQALVPILNARNVDLVTYEAGQGLVNSGSELGNEASYEKLNNVNRHPRMYDLYTEYLQSWAQFGDLMTLYTDIRRYDQWSNYGLLERWDQSLSEAHKFRAVVDFLQASPQPAPAPFLSFPTSSLNFGSVNLGSVASTTFEVGNEGTATLTVSGFAVDNAMFSVEPSQFDVSPGTRQTVTAHFTPTAAGAQTGTLTMTSNDPQSPTVDVALSGTGVGVPNLTLSTTTLDFGSVTVGDNNTLVLTLMNTGTGTLTVTEVRSDEEVFGLVGLTNGVSIGVGESATVEVRFEPQAGVGYGGILTIVSNDPNRPTIHLPVLGAGSQPRGRLVVSADTLDFGGVAVGQANTLVLTLMNEGSGALTISNVQSDESAFAVQMAVRSLTLPPNEGVRISIRFAPTEGVGYGGSLRIVSDDPDQAEVRVVFLGAGFEPRVGRLMVRTEALNFGAMQVGDERSLTVVIDNTGDGVLQVQDVHSDLSGVSISEPTFAVAQGQEHAVTVTYRAEHEGLIHGALTIVSNDGDSPEVTVPIRAAVRLAEPGEAVPGRVVVDLDTAEGNQRLTHRSDVRPGDIVTLAVYADGLPEVSGVGFLLMFDPTVLTFVTDGFVAGDFIAGATFLATDWGGILDVGGVSLSGATGSGTGLIGQVRFEVQEAFADSTFLALTQVGFTSVDGSLHEERVRVIARLEAGIALVGDFNGDGEVSFPDFILFAAAFGGTDSRFDLNGDGIVGFPDFLIFGQAFGRANGSG